jgi:hypothetical protein
MKKIFFLLFAIIIFQSYSIAQCPQASAQVLTTHHGEISEVGAYNSFGVRITLNQVYSEEVSVTGVIFDSENHSVSANFNIAIPAGYLTQDADDLLTSGRESFADATINSVTQYSNPNCFDSKFFLSGQLHNLLLTNVLENYSPLSNINYDSAINSIMYFNKSAFQAAEYDYFGETQSNDLTMQECQNFKYFANFEDFKSKLLSSTDPNSLDSFDYKVANASFVNSANKQLFSRITQVIRQNLNGTLSNSELKDSLTNLENVWLDLNGNSPSTGSDLTGVILSIGVKSCEFWEENIDSLYEDISYIEFPKEIIVTGPNDNYFKNQSYYVAAPVAMDIAGAVIGAVGSAINQWVNNGEVHAGGVVVGAVLGAVSTSTGLAGKLVRWFKSFF